MSLLAPYENIASFNWSSAETPAFFRGFTTNDPPVYDPYITGYSLIKWIKVPTWLEQSKTPVGNRFQGFRSLTEKNFRNFSGISAIEMTPLETQEGHGGSPTAWAGSTTRFQGFSMTHRELSGSPIRSAYSFWVSSIRDPQTNIATYPKNEGISYSAANHTGELLYIATRPDVDNVDKPEIIEFACVFTMVMPLRIPLDHLNYTGGGSQEVVEIEMPFTGIPNISSKVDEYAAQQIKDSFGFVGMGEWDPLSRRQGTDSG